MTDASQDFETAQNFGNFIVEATQELPASPLAKKRDADSATSGTDRRTNDGTPTPLVTRVSNVRPVACNIIV